MEDILWFIRFVAIIFILAITYYATYNVGIVNGMEKAFYTKKIVQPKIRVETINGASDTTYIYKF